MNIDFILRDAQPAEMSSYLLNDHSYLIDIYFYL